MIDAKRLKRALTLAARANNAVDRTEALAAIRRIQRRLLHRAWLKAPEIEGSTLELPAVEDERVRVFLRDKLGFDLNAPDLITRRDLTPRAVDRARWAAYLRLCERCTLEAARFRVASLLRDERRYWSRVERER